MKRYSKGILACVSVLCSLGVSTAAPAIDDEGATVPPVLISAMRTEQSVESATSSVTVITAKELQERQIINVADALRLVVGVDVTQTGGPGGATSVFLRGAESDQTLVLIDNVPVNSPTVGAFDFADLTTDNIERIEVVRGPQSTLYGSDAIGGVINIVTKKGTGEPTATLSLEGGRYDTSRAALSVAGQSGPIDYSLAVSHERTDGFSRVTIGTEPDGYLNTTLSMKLGAPVAGDGRVELAGRYWLGQAELDGFGALTFLPADDLGAWQRSEGLVTSVSLQKPLATWWNQRLAASVTTTQYINKFFDAFALPLPTYVVGEFDTRVHRLDWQHDLAVGEPLRLTVGTEYEGQMGENSGDTNRHTINNVGFFAQGLLTLPLGLSQTTGVRYDVNNRYGNTTTYKAEVAYLVPVSATRLRAGYGTGFRGPTITDLFYPNFANPNLKPERSESAEIGIEQPFWEKRIVISVTQFRTNFDDLIQFAADPSCVAPSAPFGFCPVNVAKARSEGQELLITARPVPQATVTASYTHLTARDRSTPGHPLLLRRPRGKAHFGVTANPIAPWVVTGDVNYVSQRNDVGGVAGAYWVVRLASQYQVARWLQLFGRVENLTNREYEETLGYQAAGLSIFGGLRVTGP